MKIVFRVDSSKGIGSGHVLRCLTLAEALRKKRARIFFICRDFQGNLISLIKKNNYPVAILPWKKKDAQVQSRQSHREWLGVPWRIDARETIATLKGRDQADWLILDHYAIDKKWENALRSYAKKIMVIDDLADREHDCDLLLDQNYYDNMVTRYRGLVSKRCQKLLGPRYALLRPEFAAHRKKLHPRDGRIRRILIFFGSGDLNNTTAKVLRALALCQLTNIRIDVMIGLNNPHRLEIVKITRTIPGSTCHNYIDNVATLMAQADLFIGAGGITTYERCCLGLPSLVITTARNQIEAIRTLDQQSFLDYLGTDEKIKIDILKKKILFLLSKPQNLKKLSAKSKKLVDGNGVERSSTILLHHI